VKDLLEALYRITAPDLTQDELGLWWKRDFLVPRYLYTGDGPLALGGTHVFSEMGMLEDVQHDVPLDVYRQDGHLIDRVLPEDCPPELWRRGVSQGSPLWNATPLYTWGQVHRALKIYRHSHPVVNILRMTQKIYAAWCKLYAHQLNRALQRPRDARIVPSGRPKASEVKKSQRKKAIVAGCKKWRPICEGLNKAFNGKNGLWKDPEYHSSALYQKEARGRLAKQYGILIADVEAIETYLQKPSRRTQKSTPTQAMYRMVTRLHLVGEKTVGAIWGDYLKDHPQERRRKRAVQ
jgi:hypothetical protein